MWWSLWSAATAPRWATRCAALCSLRCPAPQLTAIKIAGVQHEFSTIPGVKEDVTEIVLNVKSLITKLHTRGRQDGLTLRPPAPARSTAGDIKC